MFKNLKMATGRNVIFVNKDTWNKGVLISKVK